MLLMRLLEEMDEKKVSFGIFNKGLLNYYGVMVGLDGASYEGEMLNGKKHGKGILRNPKKEYYYEGEFKDGYRWGYGTEFVGKGASYKGEFVRNLKEGEGNLVTSEYKYEGSFKKNKFHGYGKCVWKDKRQYEGQWEAGYRHGFGTFSWPDGRVYKGKVHSCRPIQSRQEVR